MKKRTIAVVLSKRFQEENLEISTRPVCDTTTLAVQIDISRFAGILEGQFLTGFERKSGPFVHLEESSDGFKPRVP